MNQKNSKVSKKETRSYNLNGIDREYQLEKIREQKYERQTEKWEEQERRNWDKMDMLDNWSEM